LSDNQSIVVMANPAARNGRGAREAHTVSAALRGFGKEVREIRGTSVEESLDLALAAVSEGCDTLVVIGGDGIVNVAVQALVGTDTALGIVPTGTGNDAARGLGLPLGDVAEATTQILNGTRRSVDLARIDDRHYLTALAAGFDAAVAERANNMSWPKGQARYNLAILAELRAFKPRNYRLTIDGEVLEQPGMLVAVANGPSFGGGIRIAHHAQLDDGLLDVVVVDPVPKLELIKMTPKLRTGAISEHPAYKVHRASSVTIEAPDIVGYADGERFGPLPLTVQCVPGALTVIA